MQDTKVELVNIISCLTNLLLQFCVSKKFITDVHHVCDVYTAATPYLWLMVLLIEPVILMNRVNSEAIHSVNHISSLLNGEITEPPSSSMDSLCFKRCLP